MSQATEPVGGQAQPLVEHLLELRRRLVWASRCAFLRLCRLRSRCMRLLPSL